MKPATMHGHLRSRRNPLGTEYVAMLIRWVDAVAGIGADAPVREKKGKSLNQYRRTA